MDRRLSFLIAVTFFQVLSASSTVYAENISERLLNVIAHTADRICGVVKDAGSVSSTATKGVVSVELRGLASQLGTAGLQGSGGITTEEYQGVVREQLALLMNETTKCKLQVFQILSVKLLPGNEPQNEPPRIPKINTPTYLPCQKEQVTNWLDQHGIYGNRPFDISAYDDAVDWVVNGIPSRKTRADIAREEATFRNIYPMQRYTPTTSSAATADGRCVLTQEVDGYKKNATGKVEFSNFRFVFGIRINANEPRIVERRTDVVSSRR